MCSFRAFRASLLILVILAAAVGGNLHAQFRDSVENKLMIIGGWILEVPALRD